MGVKPYAGAMKEMIENTELRRVCGGEGRKTAKSIAKTTMEEYVHAWVTSISKAR